MISENVSVFKRPPPVAREPIRSRESRWSGVMEEGMRVHGKRKETHEHESASVRKRARKPMVPARRFWKRNEGGNETPFERWMRAEWFGSTLDRAAFFDPSNSEFLRLLVDHVPALTGLMRAQTKFAEDAGNPGNDEGSGTDKGFVGVRKAQHDNFSTMTAAAPMVARSPGQAWERKGGPIAGIMDGSLSLILPRSLWKLLKLGLCELEGGAYPRRFSRAFMKEQRAVLADRRDHLRKLITAVLQESDLRRRHTMQERLETAFHCSSLLFVDSRVLYLDCDGVLRCGKLVSGVSLGNDKKALVYRVQRRSSDGAASLSLSMQTVEEVIDTYIWSLEEIQETKGVVKDPTGNKRTWLKWMETSEKESPGSNMFTLDLLLMAKVMRLLDQKRERTDALRLLNDNAAKMAPDQRHAYLPVVAQHVEELTLVNAQLEAAMTKVRESSLVAGSYMSDFVLESFHQLTGNGTAGTGLFVRRKLELESTENADQDVAKPDRRGAQGNTQYTMEFAGALVRSCMEYLGRIDRETKSEAWDTQRDCPPLVRDMVTRCTALMLMASGFMNRKGMEGMFLSTFEQMKEHEDAGVQAAYNTLHSAVKDVCARKRN